MALIKCPECGKEISEKSSKCINCGYPLNPQKSTRVAIKLPPIEKMATGWVGLFASKDASISIGSKTVWSGKLGQTAIFNVSKVTKINIDLGTWGVVPKSTVEPGRKYALVQDMSPHWKATFFLSEVDIIDSD